MAINKSHQPSDLQKKLKLLEYQLYGKQEKLDNQTSNLQSQNLSSNVQQSISTSDTAYLRQDLTKIAVLASLAVAAQIILYFGSRFNFLRIF